MPSPSSQMRLVREIVQFRIAIGNEMIERLEGALRPSRVDWQQVRGQLKARERILILPNPEGVLPEGGPTPVLYGLLLVKDGVEFLKSDSLAKVQLTSLVERARASTDKASHTATSEDQKVSVTGNREEAVSGRVSLYVGKNLILEASESITLRVDGGWLVIDQTGVTTSNSPPNQPVVNRGSPPLPSVAPKLDDADSQGECLAAGSASSVAFVQRQRKESTIMPYSTPPEQPKQPTRSVEALASQLLEGPGRLFAIADASHDEQVLAVVRKLGIQAQCLYTGDEAIRLAAYALYLLSFGDTLHPLARYLI